MKDIFCWCCFDDNDCFLVVPGLFLTAWDQIVWHRCLLCLRREFYPQKPGRKYFVKFSTDKALRHLQELFTLPCIDVLIFHLFMNHVSWPYPEHLYWLDFSCFIEGWDLQAVSHLHLTLGSVWHFQKDLPSIKILPTWSTVPVMTVPWPFIEKQWSTESRAPPPLTLKFVCFHQSLFLEFKNTHKYAPGWHVGISLYCWDKALKALRGRVGIRPSWLRWNWDDLHLLELCLLEGKLQLLGHLLQHSNALLRRQQVSLIEDNQHGGADNLSNHKALCCLRLDALGTVNNKDHEVDDLGAPNDGLDEGGMAGAVD